MNKKTLNLIFIFSAVLTFSCTSAHFAQLKREPVRDENTITGSFTLILHGNRYGDDFKTVAFLDTEGDEYTFEPYAPAFDYSVTMPLKAEEALKEAVRFVSDHESVRTVRISRIADRQGVTLGYEARPLYRNTRFPRSDLLDVSYYLEGKKVVIYIRLKHFVERYLDRDRLFEDD